jgi:uncharacterized protein
MSTSKTAFPFVTRLLADSSPTLSLCVLAVCATLAGNASAASFHCSTRSSASEKIVCADPELSSLDYRLAVSYQRARDASPDPRSVETARIQQWLWRQHNCTDKACVLNWYQRRIAELDADYEQGKQAQHDAFEAALVDQKLVPSAADAVRQLKNESIVATAQGANPATK